MRSSFHKTWHAVEVCTNGSLDYLPYHHVRALTKSFFFSDTEPTAAVEKVPNSPYEFLEVNDIDLGRNPRPRPRLREPNAESSLTSFWLFNTIIREGRNIPAFEYSNDLHWRDFFFGGGGGVTTMVTRKTALTILPIFRRCSEYAPRQETHHDLFVFILKWDTMRDANGIHDLGGCYFLLIEVVAWFRFFSVLLFSFSFLTAIFGNHSRLSIFWGIELGVGAGAQMIGSWLRSSWG